MARYQIIVSNTLGEQVALITDESPAFKSFNCTHSRNAPGQCRFEVDGSMASFFEVDGQIELRRRAPELGITDWYTEWEGFHIGSKRETRDDGTSVFVSTGAEYLDLLRREEIGYLAGTSYTDKNGPGETVIKQFVDENIGPGAASSQRIDNGVRPGVTIQQDQGLGLNWQGSRAWKPLLSTVQEIADATGLAFDMASIGPAQFEFRVYQGQRGKDRSKVGLNHATGRNAAGNAPVIFSTVVGNMLTPSIEETRADEINVVYVLGQGEKADRNVLVVKDALAAAASPWNRRVVSRNASQESSNDALQSTGDGALEERRLQTVLTFQPLQTLSTVYGRHYFFGDRVTAVYEDLEFNLEIAEVALTISDQGEELRFQFR